MNPFTYKFFLCMALLFIQQTGIAQIRAGLPDDISAGGTVNLPKAKYQFKVKHHVFRHRETEAVWMGQSRLTQCLTNLNRAFANIDVVFIDCGIDYIDVDVLPSTFTINEFAATDDERRYCDPRDVAGCINIYYTPRLTISTKNRSGEIKTEQGDGKASFPEFDKKNGIRLLINHQQAEQSSLIHEMGHFFNLYHTFESNIGSDGMFELVNGSNCSTAGDKVCDTPAEWLQNGSGSNFNPKCEYIGTAVDGYQEPYAPQSLSNNYMTYVSNSGCRQQFTQGQYQRMASVGLRDRLDLMIPYETSFNNDIYGNNGGRVLVNTVASSILSSQSQITGNSDVKFRANQEIILKKGFRVEKNSLFNAKIVSFCEMPHRANGVILPVPLRDVNEADFDHTESEHEHVVERSQMNVYPNPNTGSGNIGFYSYVTGTAFITIYDGAGNKVYAAPDQQVSAGFNTFDFDLGTQTASIYSAVLQIDGKLYTSQFVIAR